MNEQKPKLNDKAMLDGLRQMNDLAIEHIYSRFYPMIFKMIKQKNGNESDARDIFQEAIVVVFEKCRHADFELTSSLGTFLFAISRNLWNKKRSRVYHREYTTDDRHYMEKLTEEAEDPKHIEQFELLKKHFQKISDKCRELLQLTYYSAMKDKDIASMLGLSGANYVKTQRYRCINQLRTLFNQK